ncbi:hypothetical protein PR202_gb12138 [Eleusine coracana subsp. coracana]|uniref:F-box domain-containing protein n=1 Tax=Eleusine coracana subsp. coracana TaxID=191504 RepID=A0AAV5EQ85_ELECO|nr:hypothetical protein PR202_gb12138 [Eleusine coracana subsp. coracana]
MGGRTMAAPLDLIDNVAAEIFLRLPPDEPEHLVRASVVCKPWFRLLTDPGFLRSYRAFHRTPPLLGYLHRRQIIEGEAEARLFPTTAAPLAPNPYFRRSLDCHHGRVLLHSDDGDWHLVVWDPVTGDQKRVPETDINWVMYTAAVVCAVSGCDHLDCHGGAFRVAFVATEAKSGRVKACVTQMKLQHTNEAFQYYYVQPRRVAVIGDEIFITVLETDVIVKYDMRKNCLSLIYLPSKDDYEYNIALMEMEDSSLGFVYMRGSKLYLWSEEGEFSRSCKMGAMQGHGAGTNDTTC